MIRPGRPADRLIGTLEVAHKLGGTGANAHKVFLRQEEYLYDRGFPKPHPAWPGRRLYSEALVDAWLQQQPGQPGIAAANDAADPDLAAETALLQARLA